MIDPAETSASHCLKHPETMLPESTAALQHGNFIMTESAAINTYLADAFRGHVPELVPPAGSQLRGRPAKAMEVNFIWNNIGPK